MSATAQPAGPSLRRRLLGYLLLAIVLTASTQTVVAYQRALNEAGAIFDYHMQQMALSLAAFPQDEGGAEVEPADPPASAAGEFAFFAEVWSADGRRVFASAPDMPLPPPTAPGFSEVVLGARAYRVLALQRAGQWIQVAQDMAVREDMAGTLALRAIAPVGLLAPVLMALAWWVVSSSLSPLERVRRQVASRQADRMEPVDERGVPREVHPLVREINLLLDRLRHALEAEREFVADAAHELRTPLATLKLQVEGVRRSPDAGRRELALARLGAGLDRATHLVEQLLVLAREQARLPAASGRQAVELAELVRQVVADAVPRAVARGIDLGMLPAQPCWVRGQDTALRMLVGNVVDNAVKYTPAGGCVDVEVRTEAGACLLAVDDSGPGLSAPERERAFDRFFRGSTEGAEGSGLGLAIVRSVAQSHDAEVRLDRSARHGGLRVEVRLPAGAPPGPA